MPSLGRTRSFCSACPATRIVETGQRYSQRIEFTKNRVQISAGVHVSHLTSRSIAPGCGGQ